MKNIGAANVAQEYSCRRQDRLTAQRIEVGLVFLEMLGKADAMDYFLQCKVAQCVVQRVLTDAGKKRLGHDCWAEK